jgi:hypothetical protein
MLSHDMVMVLPSMVLERSEALESWLNSVPWHDFELADARTMYLGKGAALLTYRATARQGAGRAQLPRAVHQCLSQGRWALAADVPAADTVEQQHRLRWVAGPS